MGVVRLVLCALLGAVTSVATVAVHQRTWGLVLAVAAVVATTVAIPAGWFTRLPFGLGYAVVLGLAVMPTAGGDVLVPANGKGYALLGLGFVLVLASVATLPRPTRSPTIPG